MNVQPARGASVAPLRPMLAWWAVGITLAVLEFVVFATQDRGIGAATSYSYLAALVWPPLRNASWARIALPGAWEGWFLLGGFLGAWAMARARRRAQGAAGGARSPARPSGRRLAGAFLGGFLLILGARLADGCTSGHILSGGIQLAVSSLWFAGFAILGGVLTVRVSRARGLS